MDADTKQEINATLKLIEGEAGHEHRFEYQGYAAFVGTNMGVWWWACVRPNAGGQACGLHVWHHRGHLERGILTGKFVSAENAPKEFDRNA